MWTVALLLLSVAAALGADEPLSPQLLSWQRQIEERGRRPVQIVRVRHDAARNEIFLDEETPRRAILTRVLSDPTLVAMLMRAHALSYSHSQGEEQVHFVLLNLATADQWHGEEEALVAHELGHLWLTAQGYPRPLYIAGPEACAAVNANDMVQHVLIRAELRARRIDYERQWRANLASLRRQMEAASPGPVDRCVRMAMLEQWVDVRLGLAPRRGSENTGFLAVAEARHPELRPVVDEIVGHLRARDIRDQGVYTATLQWTLQRLAAVP